MVIRDELALADHDVATDWRHAAECVRHAHDVNFFPERGESGLKAKTVCVACPVRQPCLEFAMRTNVSCGVWGGLTGQERRQLRRQRQRQSRRTQLTR